MVLKIHRLTRRSQERLLEQVACLKDLCFAQRLKRLGPEFSCRPEGAQYEMR